MIYTLYTLVDITETGQYRSRSDRERLQQQNFDSVIQTIGLAGNIESYKKPEVIDGSIFGNPNVRCWRFEWSMEREQVFEYNGDELYRLKELFEFVPVIVNLTESTQIDPAVFRLGRNIIFDFKP